MGSGTRYIEKITALRPSQFIDYYVTFSHAGNKLVQTFGIKDTHIYVYDSEDNLIASDDDSGYSLNGSLTFKAMIGVQYRIRVKFYSMSQTGEIKFAVMPVFNSDVSFDNIHLSGDSLGGIVPILHNGSVSEWKYQLTSSKTVTLQTDKYGTYAYADTYLYLIDPRSTLPVSSNFSQPSVYNDDNGGNLQAKITKTLDANVPYLLLISHYNLNSASTVCQVHVTIH